MSPIKDVQAKEGYGVGAIGDADESDTQFTQMLNCPKCGLIPTITGTCPYCGSKCE